MKQYAYVKQFACLGADCEDTCCKGWGMQVGPERVALYEKEAPELLKFVTTGEAEHIMKRDPETDFCVKFDNGLCGIHKDYGDRLLGDACHFFPRVTRKFGDETTMAAALSCPEIVRLAVIEEGGFEVSEETVERVPDTVKSYLPEGIAKADALHVTSQLIEFVLSEDRTAERSMACLAFVLMTLEGRPEKDWPMAVKMYLQMVENMLPEAEPNPVDPFYLLQTIRGLIHASKKSNRSRLDEVLARMEKACGISIDLETLDIMQNVGQERAYAERLDLWQEKGAADAMQPYLRRWMASQIAMNALPFAGFGGGPKERAIITSVRFATIRLGLLSSMQDDGAAPDEGDVVFVMQSLARFMDHLADPELSINMYGDAGWVTEARLRGLVGDA